MNNKNFKFKHLKYALISFNVICIILLIFGLSNSNLIIANGNSMFPTIKSGNALVFKKQASYNLFDIIVFKQNGILITHRIVDIKIEQNAKIYICSGDNVALLSGKNSTQKNELLKTLTYSEIKELEGVQGVSENEILGKVTVNSAFLGVLVKFKTLILALFIVPTIMLILKRS